MTKEELAGKNFESVRKDPTLFGLFKKYATEDAGLMYTSGKLPAGCFGCQSRNIFSRWAKIYRENNFKPTQITATMSTQITYVLKNKASKYFFGGKILSNKSTDAEWIKWVENAKTVEERERRLAVFDKLPKGFGGQEEEVVEEVVESVDATDVNEFAEEVEAVVESVELESSEADKPKRKRTKKASK